MEMPNAVQPIGCLQNPDLKATGVERVWRNSGWPYRPCRPTWSGGFEEEAEGAWLLVLQGFEGGHRYSRYAGPANAPEIAARVERFRDLKADFTGRRRMVSALKAAGLPPPDAFIQCVPFLRNTCGYSGMRAFITATA